MSSLPPQPSHNLRAQHPITGDYAPQTNRLGRRLAARVTTSRDWNACCGQEPQHLTDQDGWACDHGWSLPRAHIQDDDPSTCAENKRSTRGVVPVSKSDLVEAVDCCIGDVA